MAMLASIRVQSRVQRPILSDLFRMLTTAPQTSSENSSNASPIRQRSYTHKTIHQSTRSTKTKTQQIVMHIFQRGKFDPLFIHSGHFYSAPSSSLLLRGAPDYSTDTVSEFHAEVHMQLQVKDLPKVTTWRLERESNPRPSG